MFVNEDMGSPTHYLRTSIVIGKLGKNGCRFTKSCVYALEFLKFHVSSITKVTPREGGCMKVTFKGYRWVSFKHQHVLNGTFCQLWFMFQTQCVHINNACLYCLQHVIDVK
jgi:hypothetical protein